MEWIRAILPSLLVGICMAWWNRMQRLRDERLESHTQIRKQESLLSMEMQMATAKLAYASAMALKRGSPNGEVEEGIRAYDDARKKYLAFLNAQAANHIEE